MVLHKSADKMIEPAFYEEVTNKQIRTEIEELTEKENGFYRMEQSGTTSENAANLIFTNNSSKYFVFIHKKPCTIKVHSSVLFQIHNINRHKTIGNKK